MKSVRFKSLFVPYLSCYVVHGLAYNWYYCLVFFKPVPYCSLAQYPIFAYRCTYITNNLKHPYPPLYVSRLFCKKKKSVKWLKERKKKMLQRKFLCNSYSYQISSFSLIYIYIYIYVCVCVCVYVCVRACVSVSAVVYVADVNDGVVSWLTNSSGVGFAPFEFFRNGILGEVIRWPGGVKGDLFFRSLGEEEVE